MKNNYETIQMVYGVIIGHRCQKNVVFNHVFIKTLTSKYHRNFKKLLDNYIISGCVRTIFYIIMKLKLITLFFFFVVYAMIMCANVFGGLLIMFHSSEYEAFMLSILYAFLFTPASFLCWYVLYNTKLFFFFYNLIC